MSVRNKKMAIIGIGLLAVAVIFLAYQAITARNEQSATVSYYQELATRCGGDDCCVRSVQAMERGAFKLLTTANCRLGYQENRLDCQTSYRWCEPPALAK